MSPPTQNRRVIRLRCSYPVSCAMLGKRFPARVVDMGLEGLRLQLPGPVEPRQLLALRYEGPAVCYEFDTVQARVVWSRPLQDGGLTEVGVTFLHPLAYLERSWIRHLLRVFDLGKMTARDRRRDVRVPAALQASLLDGPATVRDVGVGGALLESSTDLAVGTAVEVAIGMPDGTMVPCEGVVVRAQRLGRERRWLLGVRFPAPPEAYREQVGQVLRAAHG